VEVLQGFAPRLLPALARRHAGSLHTLHLASVKEDRYYTVLDLQPSDLAPFLRLHTVSLDYDNLSPDLLLTLAQPGRCHLRHLSIMVHGLWAGHESVDDATWLRARQGLPRLEVTLVVLHTYEGVAALTSILCPHMPLVRLRQYFCGNISAAAITFIGNHMSEDFRELEVVESLGPGQPQPYTTSSMAQDPDPFVMLAWRCNGLQSLRLIGL
jgi:hypothetical protein